MAKYDESNIKTLDPIEHIRLRTGMYIGRLGDGENFNDGIYILLKEVIDNCIDEFIMGVGARVEITTSDAGEEGTRVSVRDYGRGIPLGKVVECVSEINTGAKYNSDAFQFSVGLNGVGTKAVNALSSSFLVRSTRDGKYAEARFERGKLIAEKKGKSTEENGTYVEFCPDKEIFDKNYAYQDEFIVQRLWNYAYLNAGLRLIYNGTSFYSRGGLLDLLGKEVGDDAIYPIGYYKNELLEMSFTHSNNRGETYFSFVNGQYTNDGGTHESAFKEGLLKGINEYYKKSYDGIDVREGIMGAIAIKLQDPVFESQTKNKLGNTEVRSWIVKDVRAAVMDYLLKNKEAAEILEKKIAANEKLRKEFNVARKEAREAAKRITIKIPSLRDCKIHLTDKNARAEETSIFLTEGQSASGSLVSARDVMTQAIFSLRGKPQNLYGKKRSDIYKNAEFYHVMMALGIEKSIDNLRYGKIIIATDADFDGFHIRNLLLTFFLCYFRELVEAGRVYILETPLFRVRNKQETRYCYDIEERDLAMSQIRGSEVTRFKGLGEISPKEFGQFIGKDMKLIQVDTNALKDKDIQQVLDFYMGKNTPERRSFIMENLL